MRKSTADGGGSQRTWQQEELIQRLLLGTARGPAICLQKDGRRALAARRLNFKRPVNFASLAREKSRETPERDVLDAKAAYWSDRGAVGKAVPHRLWVMELLGIGLHACVIWLPFLLPAFWTIMPNIGGLVPRCRVRLDERI